jgi:hypothetical protein
VVGGQSACPREHVRSRDVDEWNQTGSLWLGRLSQVEVDVVEPVALGVEYGAGEVVQEAARAAAGYGVEIFGRPGMLPEGEQPNALVIPRPINR